mgnify:FL=1
MSNDTYTYCWVCPVCQKKTEFRNFNDNEYCILQCGDFMNCGYTEEQQPIKNIQMEYTDFRFLDRDTKGDILDAFIKVYEHEFEELMKGFSDGANGKELDEQKEIKEGNRAYAEGYTCAVKLKEIWLVDVNLKR